MEVAPTFCISVTEATQVGEARRQAVRLAESRGLAEATVGRVALVATELASNLVKHTGRGGELLVRPLDDAGIELLALDRGAGMENVARCLQDGFSTAGSPGTGLGAVSRLSDLFQIYSVPGQGTAIMAQVGIHPAEGETLTVGGVSRTMPGQEVCGDAWAAIRSNGTLSIMLADGLGHGPEAAEASSQAIRVFGRTFREAPAEILLAIQEALRSTRGAAVAVAEIVPAKREVRFAGVGNIAGVVLDAETSRSMVSHNGIVGHEMRRVQEFSYPWSAGSVLVLHSDGVSSRWDLGRYPGLWGRHPTVIAGVLYRDFARSNDDATAAVVRDTRAPAGFAA